MPRIREIYIMRSICYYHTKTHHLSDRDDEFSAASDNASACMMCAVQVNRHAPPYHHDQYRAILAQHSSFVLSARTTSLTSSLYSNSSLGPLRVAATAGSRSGTPGVLLSAQVTDASLLVSSAALRRRRALSSASLTPGIMPGP